VPAHFFFLEKLGKVARTTLQRVVDDRGDAAHVFLSDAERRFVELVAEALVLELRGVVHLLDDDAGVHSADAEEDAS
jgi:hypothetical protein